MASTNEVSTVKLNFCDVLVCINDRKNPLSRIKRGAMGRYEHVEMYLGDNFYGIPLLYESDNRGVAIQNVAHQRGRKVRVMRPKLTDEEKVAIIRTAVKIASDSKSHYDWLGLIRFAALRVLRRKIYKGRPLNYRRDNKYICSEAVAEAYWLNDVGILPKERVPIPADFAKESATLTCVAEGNLLKDLIQ